MGSPWAIHGTPWDGSVEWRRPAEEGGGGKPPLECVQEFMRCLTRRQGAADDGKRPLRRLRVAVAKHKGGGWGGGARDRIRMCGFTGDAGASERPFSTLDAVFFELRFGFEKSTKISFENGHFEVQNRVKIVAHF